MFLAAVAVLAQKFWGGGALRHLPLHHRVYFLCSPKQKKYELHIQCVPKSDTLLVSEFSSSTLVRCIIFAIFVYLHIIYIKCLISEPVQVYCRQYRWTLQPYDAPSHTVKNTINYRYLKRENVSFIKPQMWPPNSPDLNPVDYAIWGALQQQV